jgi:hypothetical protein
MIAKAFWQSPSSNSELQGITLMINPPIKSAADRSQGRQAASRATDPAPEAPNPMLAKPAVVTAPNATELKK